MERELIGRYIANFRRFISPFTKDGVSVKATAYPYKHGGIVVFKMNFEGHSSTEFRAESESMQEAMRMTELFDKPEDATTITSTKIVWEGNTVIIIKGESQMLWDERASKTDVDNLLRSIEEKHK